MVGLKNLRWSLCRAQPQSGAFVISLGNLSAGGTGKTPLGLALARWLRERDQKVEVILRGYGAEEGFSDEAELYRQALGEERVHQEADRVLALKSMVSKDADVVLLDDAFQHRRAHRDLDLVLWDLSAPRGEAHCFPLGLLREPMGGLKRADAVVLTRSDDLDEEQRSEVLEVFSERGWGGDHFFAGSKPSGLKAWPGGEEIEMLEGPCFLVSGIGRPEAFEKTALELGLKVQGHRWYPDHHPFSESDIDEIWKEAEAVGATEVMVTSKDAVKWGGQRQVWVLEVATELDSTFWSWLERKLEQGRA